MDEVKSEDGTAIAFDRVGTRPAVLLVGGAIDNGAENAPLGPALGDRFTVYNYARRGRGESGDSPPYAAEREIEDLDAIITEAGGSACLRRLVRRRSRLGGAAAALAIDWLAVCEVPYAMADEGPHWDRRDVPAVEALLAEGRRGDVVELFMRMAVHPRRRSPERKALPTGLSWSRSRTRSPLTRPSWEMATRLQNGSRGSPSPRS